MSKANFKVKSIFLQNFVFFNKVVKRPFTRSIKYRMEVLSNIDKIETNLKIKHENKLTNLWILTVNLLYLRRTCYAYYGSIENVLSKQDPLRQAAFIHSTDVASPPKPVISNIVLKRPHSSTL